GCARHDPRPRLRAADGSPRRPRHRQGRGARPATPRLELASRVARVRVRDAKHRLRGVRRPCAVAWTTRGARLAATTQALRGIPMETARRPLRLEPGRRDRMTTTTQAIRRAREALRPKTEETDA